MKVICFGDSNTYGYDPRGYFGGRYDADSRWVDILAVETGWTVYNMGQNGREIPSAAPAFPANTDLLIIMLGTNDLLQGCSPGQAAEGLERFLSGIPLDRSKILLIGNVIEQEFTKGNNWHLGSGLSLVLMVFILISMAMIAKYDKNGEGTAF